MHSAMIAFKYFWCITFTICRRGLSTDEHFHALSLYSELASKYTVPTYLALIDYDDMQGCPSQQNVNKPEENSSPIRYRKLIDYSYVTDPFGMFFSNKRKYFRNKHPISQSDPFSPAFFRYILEKVFKISDWKNKKYGILMEQNGLSYLWFAEDQIIFPSNGRILLRTVIDLQREKKFAGLAIDKQILKTYAKQVDKHLKKKPLVYKEEMVNLKERVTYTKVNGKVLTQKIRLTWKNFWALKFEMSNTMRPKEKIGSRMEVEVTTCLVKGCELWYMSSEIMRKLIGGRNFMSWKLEEEIIIDMNIYWSTVLNNWTPYPGLKRKWRQRFRKGEDMGKAKRNRYEKNTKKCKEKKEEKKDKTDPE